MIATIRALIAAAALAHTVPVALMDGTAQCESHFDAFAVNPSSGALGLFQLEPRGKLAGFYARGYDNWADPAQQSNFVAEQFRDGQFWAWTCARPLLMGVR